MFSLFAFTAYIDMAQPVLLSGISKMSEFVVDGDRLRLQWLNFGIPVLPVLMALHA